MKKRKFLSAIVAFACLFLTVSCVRAPEETVPEAPYAEWVEESFFRPEGSAEMTEEDLGKGEKVQEKGANETTEEETEEEGEQETVLTGEKGTEEENNKRVSYVLSLVDGLNVRSGAGTDYSSLGTLDKGDMVAYIAKNGNWYETRYRGQKAYVSARETYMTTYEAERSDDRIERVIKVGCALLGTPYVYGATRLHNGNGVFLKDFDENKYDCSSLMQCIFYYGAGECLQVTTRTQVKQGTEVAKEEIRRGDLLFFTNDSRCKKTGIERIGHVAMYLGDNFILHTASDHAVIEKISEKRWSYYICARRILDK